MAKSGVPKPSSTKVEEPTKAEAKSENKAKEAFDRYKARVGLPHAPGWAATGYQAFGYPTVFPPAGQAGPTWAFPPSVAMLPQPAVPSGFYPAMVQPGGFTGGSLADQLGSTLRLSVDAINTVLAGGIRALTGFSGLAYAVGEQRRPSSSCGCHSCCDPCEIGCGGYDCCCAFGECCCQPSVGNCC